MKILRTIRIQAETYLKLKILSIATKTTVGSIVDNLVDSCWKSKSDTISDRVDSPTVRRELDKLLAIMIKS